jgi:dipeptidyl-peptidase-4
VRTARMQPHWISGGNTFWFRRSNAPENTTFVYVDPNQGLRQPAFDHDGVASALIQHGVKASALNLPFDRIDVSGDCATVRFRAGEKNWEWNKDGVLAPFHGDIHELAKDTLKPLEKEIHTIGSSRKTEIEFVNRTEGQVSIYWIDSDGKKKHYQDVKAGRIATQHTYEGHVWRITKAKDGEVIASFAAESAKKVAVIEKGLPVPQLLDQALSERKKDVKSDAPGVFVRENNVWFRDTNGQEVKISETGTEDSPFGGSTFPSPDKKFAVVFQSTRRQDRTVYEVESSPDDQVQPRLREFQYLKPGDNVTIHRPRLFDLTSKCEVETNSALFENPYQLYEISGGWNAEGTEFRFLYNQRGPRSCV